jgi:hypothetical protein
MLFSLICIFLILCSVVLSFNELQMPKINADRMTEIQVIVLSGNILR